MDRGKLRQICSKEERQNGQQANTQLQQTRSGNCNTELTSSSLWIARVSAEMITNHVPIVYPVTFLPV